MAGDYAKIKRSITSDLRFRELDPMSKLVYTWVLFQPKLSPCGSLDLIPKRIAKEIGISVDDLAGAIKDLVLNGYLLEDDETSEIVVKSYVRHDVNTGNDNMVKAVWNAIAQVSSPRLRGEINANLPPEMPPDVKASERPSNSVGRPFEESSESVRSSLSLSPSPQPQPAAAADGARTALNLIAAQITAAEVQRRLPTNDPIRIPSRHQAKVLERVIRDQYPDALALAVEGLEPCQIAERLNAATAGKPIGCSDCDYRGVVTFDPDDTESDAIPCPNCNLTEAL